MNKYYDKNEHNSYSDVIQALRDAQEEVKEKFGFLLSAKVSKCEIVAERQQEESVEFSFINYPKCLQEESHLQKAVLFLAMELMSSLNQNRTVVIFPHEMIMLEEDPSKIDEGISSLKG